MIDTIPGIGLANTWEDLAKLKLIGHSCGERTNMPSVRILGTGSYVPPKVLSNFDIQKMGLETSHEWIVKRTGVSERRIADPDVTTADLACEAALEAFDMAGMTAREVDLMIVATITPDTCCPSAANWLQAKLDAPQAVTFDITAACSGFIFALNVAEQYLFSGETGLVLPYCRWETRALKFFPPICTQTATMVRIF